MTVHTFEVRHIKEGLERIKAELGASAVILGTKRLGDGMLEISAKGQPQPQPPPAEPVVPQQMRPAPMIEHPALTHHIQSLQQSLHELVSQVQGLESEVRHLRLGQELHPAPSTAPSPPPGGGMPQRGSHTAQQEFRLGLEALRGSAADQGLLDALFSLQRALLHRGVLQSDVEEIMAHVLAHSSRNTSLFDLALDHMAQGLQMDVPLWSTLEVPGPQIHALIGPTGVGKTTLVAKVAAHAQWAQGKRVGIVCADDFRIGGRYQLETYARLIEVPMVTVKDLGQMRTALGGLAECDLIVVDTNALAAGSGTPGPKGLDASALSCLRPEHDLRLHLVLSASAPAPEQCRCVSTLSDLELSSLIFTKLDEAPHSLGSILSTTRATGLPISVLSDGRAVPQDLLCPTPKQLAAWILQGFRGRSRVETSDYILEAHP